MFFAIRRVSKIYPLHILTMMAAVVVISLTFVFGGASTKEWLRLFRDVILNILLLQSWYPYAGVNVSLNGVAWYLSSAFFLYFMFPYLIRFLKSIRSKNGILWFLCLFVIFIQLLISAVGLKIDPSWGFYRWIAYDAPFFRLGDFMIGCVTGLFYLNQQKLSDFKANIWEIAVVVMCIVITVWDNHVTHITYIAQILNNWTTIFIPPASLLVYLFALNQGMLTRLLMKSKVLDFIGRRSSYYFLFHYIIILYMVRIVKHFHFQISSTILAVIELSLTIVTTEIYKRIELWLHRVNS